MHRGAGHLLGVSVGGASRDESPGTRFTMHPCQESIGNYHMVIGKVPIDSHAFCAALL